MSMRPLVVVPTYNELDNLPPLVERILADPAFSVLVVDDASPDGTGRVAQELAERFPGRMQVLHRSGKQGLGTAYLAGFRYALEHRFDPVIEMDADFSHDPADLPRLLQAARDADLVLGSRYVPGGRTENWSRTRRLISRFGCWYSRTVLGLPYRDLTGGFKCFRRRTLEILDLERVHSNGYSFQIELTYRCHRRGLKIVEVPIVFRERRSGRSKMSKGIVLEAMLLVWRLRLGNRSGPDVKSEVLKRGAND